MARITFVLAAILLLPTSFATAETLLFDFGRTTLQTNPGWNNVVPATTTLFALFDSDSNIYGTAGLEITDTFFQTGEPSTAGSEAPTGDAAAYPVSATDDYFFGHINDFAGAVANPLGQFKLFNLDPASTYDFTFFSSRSGVSDARDAIYTVMGSTTEDVGLDAANNNSEVAKILSMQPDGNNEIFVSVAPGPNTANFYYIGLLQVDVNSVPEPSSLSLVALGLFTIARRTRRTC